MKNELTTTSVYHPNPQSNECNNRQKKKYFITLRYAQKHYRSTMRESCVYEKLKTIYEHIIQTTKRKKKIMV